MVIVSDLLVVIVVTFIIAAVIIVVAVVSVSLLVSLEFLLFLCFCCCYCHMQHLSGSTALVVSLKSDCEFFHASFEALCRTSRLLLCFCRCCWCDCLCCGCCCHCSAVGWSVYRFDVVSMPLWAGKGARQWIKAHKASRVTAREEEGRRSKKN